MRDYWLTQYLLGAIGWAYALVSLGAIALAVWLPKRTAAKAGWSLAVLVLISIAPLKGYEQYRQSKQAADEFKARYAKAQALFEERCKTAGEKIPKTIVGVEGILIMKIRPDKINLSDQYAKDDPFGADCWGQSCITDLLGVSRGSELNPELAKNLAQNFQWIDVVENGQRGRYYGAIKKDQPHRLSLDRVQTSRAMEMPRYGLTWEDISTKEDRDYWIAGGSLRVVDLATNEIIAEKTGFMMDKGQGNTKGERSPWAFAYDNACPRLKTAKGGGPLLVGRTHEFVFSVFNTSKRK